MSKLKKFLAWLLGYKPAPLTPVCRLNQQQAMAIARAALGEHINFAGDYLSCVPTATPSGVHWECSTITIGSSWHVIVDDATGKVIECEHWGVR